MTEMLPPAFENPERRTVDLEREKLFSDRAQRIMERYIADHPNSELTIAYASKKLTAESAFRILRDVTRDGKTGLQRADLLKYTMDEEVNPADNKPMPFCIAIFDIDDFKEINTELTHVGADDILRDVAQAIETGTRDSDVASESSDEALSGSVVRWGGEEFLVLLRNATPAQGSAAARRIQERIAATFTDRRPNNKPVTVSGGVAAFVPGEHHTWKSVLAAANTRLLAAKHQGKNRVNGA